MEGGVIFRAYVLQTNLFLRDFCVFCFFSRSVIVTYFTGGSWSLNAWQIILLLNAASLITRNWFGLFRGAQPKTCRTVTTVFPSCQPSRRGDVSMEARGW